MSDNLMSVEQVVLIELDRLKPSSVNVRQHVDAKRVRALAEDIALRGLINPLIVRREGDKYGVVCGRMRLEAITLLRKEKPSVYEKHFSRGVPCIVKELGDPEALELSLSENIRQNTLTPEEVGQALARLHEHGLSEEEISERLMLDLAQVRRALSLYRRVSTAGIQGYVAQSRPGRPPSGQPKKRISRSGLAVVLSALERHEKRGTIGPGEKEKIVDYVANMASQKSLSTSELEMLARRLEKNPELVKNLEELGKAIEEVAQMDTVERVVALKRRLAQEIEKYAEQRDISFDEALNELAEKALRGCEQSK